MRIPFPPAPSYGGASYKEDSTKMMRLLRYGCTNRPFYHLVVMEVKKRCFEPVIEQLGVVDDCPNEYNEKVVALHCDRILYWIERGALMSSQSARLLGLAGLLPFNPTLYVKTWERRKSLMEQLEELRITAVKNPEESSAEEVSDKST